MYASPVLPVCNNDDDTYNKIRANIYSPNSTLLYVQALSSHLLPNSVLPTTLKIITLTSMLGLSGGSDGKESACSAGDLSLIPGEDPLKKGVATHSSVLACKEVPRIEEPGRLQSMGSQRVQQD